MDMPRIDASERSETSLQLEEWWHSIRDGKEIPKRGTLDLLDRPELVPDIAAVEIDFQASEKLKVIFTGSSYSHRIGVEVTGVDAINLFKNVEIDSHWKFLEVVFGTPCGLIRHYDVVIRNGSRRTLELTIFPLSGSDAEPDVLAVGTCFIGFDHDTGKKMPTRLAPLSKWSWIDVGSGVPDYHEED